MEGVISPRSHLALTWWGGSGVQACGTALLEIASNSRRMHGTWQGFATFDPPYEELVRAEGRIVIARDRAKVARYPQPTRSR